MPIDYFDFKDTNGADRRGCILQENLNGLTKPTFYYLKRFIDYVNFKYEEEVLKKANGEDTGLPFARFKLEKMVKLNLEIIVLIKTFLIFIYI